MVPTMEDHVTDAKERYSSAFMRKLEEELSGSMERGITIPMVRIPGKTHLSSVLLMSNPWASRDLDRKLDHIEKERERRQKVLDWNQRHFFVSQVFDPDQKLRFTAKRKDFSREPEVEPTYGNPVGKTTTAAVGHAQSKSTDRDDGTDDDDDDDVTTGVATGIFAKPLERNLPHRPRHRKSTLPTSRKSRRTPRRHHVIDGSQTDREGSRGPRRAQMRSLTAEQKTDRKRSPPRLTLPDIGSTFKTELPHSDVTSSSPEVDVGTRGPFLVRKLSNAKLSDVDEMSTSGDSDPGHFTSGLHRSMTLPRIGRHGVANVNWSRDDSSSDEDDDDKSVAPPGDVICDKRLIAKLTRTLPTSLLIRANRSVNKIVAKRKIRMLEKCRRICARDLFQDPRWRALKETLINVEANSLSAE